MTTEKLYYYDAYIKDFSATVISCIESQKGYKVILDKTAFFPEAGGQSSDIGKIGESVVFDVQIDEQGIIYHYCDKCLKPGETFNCKIDFSRRFSFMQNHTGEHIVSGIANKLFGAQNVGFHLSDDFATVDFDIVFTRQQIEEIETQANEAVWKNLDVECLFPDEEQLKNIKYRYKKELYGAIRLVDIKGIDICACCAPHVANTGEIGIIKLLDFERVRSGVRIIMKCGSFALNDYRIKYYNIREISNLLSSKQDSAADAVGALNKKLSSEQQKVALLKRRYIDGIIKSANIDNRVVFEDDLDMKEVQLLADGLHKKLNVLSAAFSKCDDGYLFAICSECKELDAFFADFKSNLALKGGGRNGMVQGTVFADESKIRLFFSL